MVMPKRAIASVVIIAFAIVAAVAMTLKGHADASLSLSSPQNVFCSDYAHRESVVEAGIALGSLSAGSSPGVPRSGARSFSSYQNWQNANPEAFANACRNSIAALQIEYAPSPSGDGSWPLEPLIGVAVGALLTLLTSEWTSARDRIKARADTLRAATADFDATALEYISEWQVQTVKTPSAEKLHEKSASLAALLIQPLKTDNILGRDVRISLTALTEQLGSNNWPTSSSGRDQFTEQARSDLQDLVRELYEYSNKCERRHFRMTYIARSKPVSSTS
jgi:hypothetical protein